MNKIIAIASLVLGLAVFIAGIAVNNSPPILRTTEDSAINANYDAPSTNAMTNNAELANVSVLRPGAERSTIVGRTRTGKAHVRHADANPESSAQYSDELAEGPVESPSGGLFSTARARDFNPAKHYSKVPNVQYVKASCPLCTK
jgi:hypothetical protein